MRPCKPKRPLLTAGGGPGRRTAGGVGICAASDLVVAGPRARFHLPEIAWGLTPALVLPWLIRRVGFQKANEMALTGRPVTATEAHRIHLVDLLVDDPARAVATIRRRNAHLPAAAVEATKEYTQRLAGPSLEDLETALAEHHRTFAQPEVRARLAAFLERGEAPWEADRG